MADDDIELLQQLIMHRGAQAFSLIPAALKKVIIEKQWCNRVDRDGNPFTTFESFVTHRLWQGLESTIDELRIYSRKEPDVQRLILAEMEPGREHRGATKQERANRVDNIKSSHGGTSATYTLKRLKRDWPKLFQRVIDGKLSVNAAAIEAGFRKRTTPIEQLLKLVPKCTRAQLLQARARIDEELTAGKPKGRAA